MDARTFWVGEMPAGFSYIKVLDEMGNPADLSLYTSVRVRMLDSDNNEIHLDPALTNIYDTTDGRISFAWPQDKSVFTKPGDYLLQVELGTGTARRYTSVQNIIVRQFGGNK